MRSVSDGWCVCLPFWLYQGGGTWGDRKENAQDHVVLSAALPDAGGDSAHRGICQQMVSGGRGSAVGDRSVFLAGAGGSAGECPADRRLSAAHCHERIFPRFGASPGTGEGPWNGASPGTGEAPWNRGAR